MIHKTILMGWEGTVNEGRGALSDKLFLVVDKIAKPFKIANKKLKRSLKLPQMMIVKKYILKGGRGLRNL